MKKNGYRNASIWLDRYDDVFSDFDPRPYSERNISDDFISELKKQTSEAEYSINELKLLLPAQARKKETEEIVSNHLHQFIKMNFKKFDALRKSLNRKGILFCMVGASLMLVASYISSLHSDLFAYHILRVILEPGGWFLTWIGLDSLVNSFKKHRPEYTFYNKLSKAKITFLSIEDYKQN